MSDPYVGQVTPFAFPYAPAYWAFCNGGTLPINQYSTLFSLIGLTFGGDGRTAFGLPNLNGAAPCGTGAGPGLTQRQLGQAFGTATVTLDATTMPMHTHNMNLVPVPRGGTASGTPSASVGLAAKSGGSVYANGAPNATMAPTAITPSGGGQAHNNLQPTLAINYCIALMGVYPQFD